MKIQLGNLKIKIKKQWMLSKGGFFSVFKMKSALRIDPRLIAFYVNLKVLEFILVCIKTGGFEPFCRSRKCLSQPVRAHG